ALERGLGPTFARDGAGLRGTMAGHARSNTRKFEKFPAISPILVRHRDEGIPQVRACTTLRARLGAWRAFRATPGQALRDADLFASPHQVGGRVPITDSKRAIPEAQNTFPSGVLPT